MISLMTAQMAGMAMGQTTPITPQGIGLGKVATWGSVGLNVMGSMFDYASAMASAKQYKTQAIVYREEAKLIREKGLWTATYVRSEGDAFKGAQLATYAKAGVQLEGSPLEVVMESSRQVELNALMVVYEGKLQERRALQSAEMADMAARAQEKAAQAGLFGGIAGAIGGAVLFGPIGGLVGASLGSR